MVLEYLLAFTDMFGKKASWLYIKTCLNIVIRLVRVLYCGDRGTQCCSHMFTLSAGDHMSTMTL